MRTHANRANEQESPSVSNGERSDTFELQKQTTQAVAQRKLLEMVSNDKGTSQLKASPTLQRVMDITGWKHTAHYRYYAGPNGSSELVGRAGATPPEPEPLYRHRADTIDIEGAEQAVTVWTPRSRFINKNRMIAESKPEGEPDAARDPHAEETTALRLLGEIQTQLAAEEEALQAGPTAGDHRIYTAGINDCQNYATALQDLIFHHRQQEGTGNPPGQIGRKWIHDVNPDAGAAWNYHAATVVAEDTPDAVTLEGHSGKHELDAPQFHIRTGGKTGFEGDNQAGADVYEEEAREFIQPALIDDLGIVIQGLQDNWQDEPDNPTITAVRTSAAMNAPAAVPDAAPAPAPAPALAPAGGPGWLTRTRNRLANAYRWVRRNII